MLLDIILKLSLEAFIILSLIVIGIDLFITIKEEINSFYKEEK